MKTRRLSVKYRSSASSGHRTMGDLLRAGSFANHKIYQEYPVSKINPTWQSGREKFDWVILDLKAVIEVQGEQHYKPVRFGGRKSSEAQEQFKKQLASDKAKRRAAEAAGWVYIAIADEDVKNLTCDMLYRLVSSSILSQPPVSHGALPLPTVNRSKEFRRKRYLEIKRWAKKQKEKKLL